MSSENSKPMVTDVFVKGAVQGWGIATHSTIPNVLMAFVIIRALNVAGLLPILGDIFRPLMGLFGLPGEAAAVLIAGWMSMGGGVGVAAALFDQGALTVEHCAILAPGIYLMASGHDPQESRKASPVDPMIGWRSSIGRAADL